jgi:hypothetical protein
MMRLTLLLLIMLIVPVVAAAARRGGPDAALPQHRSRPHFYLMGGYPYGWASYGMLDSDLAQVQIEYDRNVDAQPRTVKQGTKMLACGCA